MTRKLQAGFVSILLLLSMSCTKENNSPLPSQAQKALTTSSADESFADGKSADVLGTWIMHYSWGCTGSYSTTSFNVFSNGTFSEGSGYTGQWVKSDELFMFHFDDLNTCYSGNIVNKRVSGISATFNARNSQGCFFMTRPAAKTQIKEERVKGQLTLSGKQ